MGLGRVVMGLAWRNVRHRPWQALLLLLALSLSTTIITLALTITESGDRAWDRASRATNGFHVDASAEVPEDASPAQRDRVRAELAGLGSEPGVVAVGGPWRTARVSGEIDGAPIALKVQVRDAGPAAVNQPRLTAGASGWTAGRAWSSKTGSPPRRASNRVTRSPSPDSRYRYAAPR
jgi:putative ABC transport system permease protein